VKKILSSPLFFPLILILLCLFLAAKNYTPGTFLTGWDTLHPEFDFALNFKRLIFGVWRTEQGFGAAAGHSHMADLPRVLILWLFHFIFPLNFLRYSYIFLCLIIGPLGIYFLIKHLFKKRLVAFLTALFYIFNLSTVQQFYVPFEMFPTEWAFLPWIILATLSYLHKPSPKKLIAFCLVTLFSTPMAYAAHLWYAFFALYLLFLLLYPFVLKTKLSLSLRLIILTLFINAFWLLPNLYYIFTSSSVPEENLTNRLHSQEFLLKNRETGTVFDAPLIKGFYFNWENFNFSSKNYGNLMPSWNQHLQNFDVLLIGYLLFFISLFGLVLVIRQKNHHFYPFIPFFVIPFIFLFNNTFPFRLFFILLLKISFLQEPLRFIFTKISILALFGQTIFLAYAIRFFFTKLSRRSFSIFSFIFILSLLTYAYPVFRGELINPHVKVKIPDSYFQFWRYMSSQPQGQTLALPLHEPSGWQYYTWGYQGSGLIWFGLPQSITDRDNDRWQVQNEEAYREFFNALYSTDPNLFLQTLHKYNIRYLLWDQSSAPALTKNRDQITFQNETDRLLGGLTVFGYLQSPKQFGSLFLYQISESKPLVYLDQIQKTVNPSYHWGYFDYQYQDQNYFSDNSHINYFPFRSVLNHYNKIDQNQLQITSSNNLWQIHLANQSFSIENPLIFDADYLHQLNPKSVYLVPNVQNRSLVYQTNQIVPQGTDITLDDLPHQQGYIIGVLSKFRSGLTLRLCFQNSFSGLCTPNDELSQNRDFAWDYFLVPPSDRNSGYELFLNALSYAKVLSKTEVQKIVVLPIPYDFLSQIVSEPQIPQNPSSSTYPDFSSNQNHSYLSLTLTSPPPSNSQIILNQSYSEGWLAFYFQNQKPIFLPHLLINNWANGWSIHQSLGDGEQIPTIHIIFWPQILEFLGFGLLFLLPLVFLCKSLIVHLRLSR
jgi:hypothetical protein